MIKEEMEEDEYYYGDDFYLGSLVITNYLFLKVFFFGSNSVYDSEYIRGISFNSPVLYHKLCSLRNS